MRGPLSALVVLISAKQLERYEWSGDTLILLVWSARRNQGYLGYIYMPIRKEMMGAGKKG
ncbi:MAG: hypothetical protein PVG99_06715 [Desulfobacteraceae bacterium]|jgi:hypothetical protein